MNSHGAFNPFRCRIWNFHDRLDEHINEITCAAEIASISRQGQLVPTLGRRLLGDPDYDVELIYGARRLFVARHLNIPLLVEVRSMTDAEAIAAMHSENQERQDISTYERGLSYSRWLRCGLFKSQEELSRTLNISPSRVSRLLRIAKLPTLLIGVFRSPLNIRESWGLDLIDAWEDPELRKRLASKARALAAGPQQAPARAVYRALMSSVTPGHKAPRSGRDEIVKSSRGTPLFRIRHSSRAVMLVLPKQNVSPSNIQQIRSCVVTLLDTPPLLHGRFQSAEAREP